MLDAPLSGCCQGKAARSLKRWLILCYGLTSPEWKVATRLFWKRAGVVCIRRMLAAASYSENCRPTRAWCTAQAALPARCQRLLPPSHRSSAHT